MSGGPLRARIHLCSGPGITKSVAGAVESPRVGICLNRGTGGGRCVS